MAENIRCVWKPPQCHGRISGIAATSGGDQSTCQLHKSGWGPTQEGLLIWQEEKHRRTYRAMGTGAETQGQEESSGAQPEREAGDVSTRASCYKGSLARGMYPPHTLQLSLCSRLDKDVSASRRGGTLFP